MAIPLMLFARRFIFLGLLLLLSACVLPWPRSNRGPVQVLPPHESWCYRTLGQIECYIGPQDLSPGTLVSVDPPSRFPLTAEDHAKALAEARRKEP